MAQTHKINRLPGTERNAVIKALRVALTEADEPNYRALNAKLAKDLPGYAALNVSHTSLFRFAAGYVKPAIAKGLAKAAEISEARNKVANPLSIDHTSVDQRTSIETERALTDDPIIKALVAKRRRLDKAIDATFDTAQYDTYAKLETVDLRALEMHAKAIQHPGWTQQQAGSGTVVQIAVMTGTADQQKPAIDVSIAEVGRRE